MFNCTEFLDLLFFSALFLVFFVLVGDDFIWHVFSFSEMHAARPAPSLVLLFLSMFVLQMNIDVAKAYKFSFYLI
jgi:hypothetical protein